MTSAAPDLSSRCADPLPALAVRGLECFNAGEYFEAHEYLESAWREEPGPIRELYRGVLQVAVGYYHLTRGNYLGTLKMFRRSRTWLAAFPEVCQGINLAQLRLDRDRVESELVLLGPARIDSFNLSLLKPVDYHLPQEG